MNPTLKAALTGVIDYAGLFPPAKLNMSQAVREYRGLRESDKSWLVDRFAVTSIRLSEFLREAQTQHARAVGLAVIGRSGATLDEWEANLAEDAEDMTAFEALVDGTGIAGIEAYETRIPSAKDIKRCTEDLAGFGAVEGFVEIPWGDGMSEALAALAENGELYAKGRTGGQTEAAFPSSETLAEFLQQCAHLDLNFKLTAGLHHPFPQFDLATGGRMHGFLNVITALALCLGQDLPRDEIVAVLDTDDSKQFDWTRETITWRGLEASPQDVKDARELFIGWGSCSVDEPVADLQALGLY